MLQGVSNMKSVVVTGVSTGIGWATAKVLVENGFRVFGSVRSQLDSERLAKEFGPSFVPLIFDVTDENAVKAGALRVELALEGETLFGLVNNAGIAVPGPLLLLPLDDVRRQLEVNLIGQLAVTQAFARSLGADRARKGAAGRIIMLSSIAGKTTLPFLGAYSASKFALEGLSEGLRRELMLFGIDVIVIGPGAVATPIWDKAEGVDKGPFSQTPYAAALTKMKTMMITQGNEGLASEVIAKTVQKALTTAHPKLRYALMPNRLEGLMMAILPKRLVDRMIAKRLGLLPHPR
jgi:NAD(P)-dependent dehydrogenase (short-subunit alcohol dehydrogenase family)